MIKIFVQEKLLKQFLIVLIALCMVSSSVGCAARSAKKKYNIRVETESQVTYAEVEQLFDEGILAFHKGIKEIAQMNLSQVVELEKSLPVQQYTALAQEYLEKIEAIEPSAIPLGMLPDEELVKEQTEKTIREKLSEKISLEFREADIKDLLSSFSTSYGLNIVCDKEVSGTVSIRLKDVTVKEALKAILDISGYRYVKKGSIIYVENISKGKVTKIFHLGYTDPAICKEIAGDLLSSQGSIKVDETFNRLIVTDLPSSIDEIEKFINNFDARIPQVLIEVKIVDITLTDLAELGIDWTGTYTSDYLWNKATQGLSESAGGTYTLGAPGSTNLPTGQFDLALVLKHWSNVSLDIDALVSDAKADLLASPKIITQNNQEARIIIGEKVPYTETTQTTTGTTETTKFIDVGTTLRVTPKISKDGYVTMHIHPEVSSVTSLLDSGPRIDTREADTVVTIKDEQTLAIGGLIKEQSTITNRKIPILGDIPLIGLLFRSKAVDIVKKELVVFITPHIIEYPDDVESKP
ncbi:MAG: secretin and TonB N-terminal domain-containing protein [Candidatus Omnitrophota bacterium]